MPAAADYTLLEPMRPERAHIRFTGRFEGRAVVWNAEVIALRAQPAPAAPFIHVGALGPEGRRLRVGLAFDALDAGALAKTVIMIRNYKRLRRGYMRFGEPERHTVTKIISGGQTGVDRAALDAARRRGVATGGYCPKGRRAEDGTIPADYGELIELATPDYPTRTRRNVAAADATLILTRGRLAGGSAYTAQVARRLGKPTLIVDLGHRPRIAVVHAWLAVHRVQVLNVAGPRESKAPGIYQDAKRFLARLWPDGRG